MICYIMILYGRLQKLGNNDLLKGIGLQFYVNIQLFSPAHIRMHTLFDRYLFGNRFLQAAIWRRGLSDTGEREFRIDPKAFVLGTSSLMMEQLPQGKI